MQLQRHPENPIVRPGQHPWRRVATFNPGAVLGADGTVYMLERACSSLAPLYSHVGLLASSDGVHFELVRDEPVFTATQLGTPYGTVEDPRVVAIDGAYLMTYVHRNYASSCHPNGVGVPGYTEASFVPSDDPNLYRSGLARSDDLIAWEDLGPVTPPEVDDRDCVLFPERIGGRYAMLRRPQHYTGAQYGGLDHPSIWITDSADLREWSEPRLVATVEQDWEGVKIGAGATPLATAEGFLLIYHGVDAAANYRTGVMLLDSEDPSRVIARCPHPIFAPETYYETTGLIIPRVVFPSANVVKDGTVYIYYGACDSCICLATVPLDELLAAVLQHRR